MKPLLFVLLILFFTACHTPEKSFLSGYLNTSDLPLQSFTINPDKDTTLISSGGVRIKIPKGSFASGRPVTIEWKEALDFNDILKAGLLTQNGKNLLRSGGMFYFNPKEKLAIEKPIDIDVPTETIASGMQLYKGDSSDGKLDWQDPKPIENVKTNRLNWVGRELFVNNCISCHWIDKGPTGPALAGMRNRGPWRDQQKLYEWMHNPAGFMAHDRYTKCLKCKYGVVMPAFPSLSHAAIDSIVAFVDDEEEVFGITGKIQNNGCDSCVAYRQAYDSLVMIRNALDKTNNNTIDVDYHFDPAPVHYIEDLYPDNEPKPKLIAQLENKSDYYHIQIDVAGWYNVDGLLQNWSGSVQSKLVVKMEGEQADKQEVYLAIPSLKIFTQGGYLDNGKDIGFLETNGTIKLPQHTQAFVFAVGEQRGKFIFSQQDFITTTDQTIILRTQMLSREQFDSRIKQIEQNGLKVSTDTTIHFSSLKGVDEKLEKMKGAILKDCGCADATKDSTSAKSIKTP